MAQSEEVFLETQWLGIRLNNEHDGKGCYEELNQFLSKD